MRVPLLLLCCATLGCPESSSPTAVDASADATMKPADATAFDAAPLPESGVEAGAADTPPPDCSGLNEPACIGVDGCVPLYDDRCCPACPPGPCGDCTDVRFIQCAPRSACDDDTVCGIRSPFLCMGLSTVCPDRFDARVDCQAAPGCVPAVDPTCEEDCGNPCVTITPEVCGSTKCDAPPPTCPEGQVPEVVGECYSGLCMPEDVCAP